MLRRNLVKSSWCRIRKRNLHETVRATKPLENIEKCDTSRIRNIGIMAHIDAGKTTTTERMLYYSGLITNPGEVHDGNTVTDYMDQERERGITITSAAVTFPWKQHKFNLIDTPGHIDFTMGVEQTLGVLDGAVVVLDGSAGVEAQTSTVWRQADRYAIPRLVYVNKMDRSDGDFDLCLNSIETKLDSVGLPTQMPLREKMVLTGLVDLLTMEKITFDKKNQGKTYTREILREKEDGMLWEEACERRRSLTDKLSSLDDTLADLIIAEESLDGINAQILSESLRRCTIKRKGVPVLLGSSYKNIGVQPLMDSVILFLPSPEENPRAKEYRCFEDNFSARAFKIIHDKQRGPITFFRVYTGRLTKGQKIYNIEREKSEQGGRLYAAYADDYEEINEITAGNIGAFTGLKYTVTGDVVTSSASAAGRAQRLFEKMKKRSGEVDENVKLSTGASIPDPVFFCSIEPPSLTYQAPLESALAELEREDPSLRVTQNEETGQTVLAGMGELHIDIIKERIRSEYKIDVDLGPLQIAYKETVVTSAKDTLVSQHKIGTTNHSVNVTLSLIPNYRNTQLLEFDKTKDNASNIAGIHPRTMAAVKRGVNNALMTGPKIGCPVVEVGVKLHWLEVGRGTSDSMITAAVSRCIRKLLVDAGILLLEPIMSLEVVTPEQYASSILADLSRRRADIQEVGMQGRYKLIRTLAPLSELLGYATALRIVSSGTATFTLEFHQYRAMGSLEEQEAIKRITGF
ncbi:ribosome-releasing factor 2, mitochondrial [Venturia canescens]|uniref:ribosome-releasing factor 2, mitochondrial n=1 Tax=Venturia canescens TaxID=32260 RepID=UPI001C9C702A|nr:ribosome-releasing factor 2, mitochondrial [Venturia canescens]